MGGLFDRLGSLGHSIVSRALEMGQSVAETVGMLWGAGIDVDAEESVVDWTRTRGQIAAEPLFGTLADDALVPVDYHESTNIAFSRPWAYKVRVLGTNLETGELEEQDFDLPVSERLTPAEALQIAFERIGQWGASPLYEIYDATLVSAYHREL